MRRIVARWLYRSIVRRARRPTSDDLAAPALVVAPHPDDETLGCGGTIALKRAASAEVAVVVMTDGSASHASFLPPPELARRREEELRTAAAALGITADSLFFLGHPDQSLSRHEERAAAEIGRLLDRLRPRQVFIPHEWDPQVDHVATRRAVLRALSSANQDCSTWEYPVWAFSRWPWSPLERASLGDRIGDFRRALGHWARARLDYDVAVPIRDRLDVKRAALAAHATQMTRPAGMPSWPVLGDVAGGEFLANFFRDHELFRAATKRSGC